MSVSRRSLRVPGVALLLTLVLAALPRAAAACAVCMAGRDEENRTAFLVTTILLSLLPPSMVLGAVLWLRKRARELAASEPQPAAPDAAVR